MDSRNTGLQRRALVLISISTLLTMSVWFSASVILAEFRDRWVISEGMGALLTVSVQFGFVAGAILLVVSGVPDRVPIRVLFPIAAAGASGTNLLLLTIDSFGAGIVLRMLTGVFLAAVYPSAVQSMATWFPAERRGKPMGVLIGALTVGSALPHLIAGLGHANAAPVVIATSIATASGGLLMVAVPGEGPYPFTRRKFKIREAVRSIKSPPVLLATVGYAGHMWELYAMWTWVGTFLAVFASTQAGQLSISGIALMAFAVIAVGGIGSVVGGILGDRIGKAKSASLSLLLSGLSAFALLWAEHIPLPMVVAICLFWGFWIIADSGQFSALLSEYCDPRYIGSALTTQLALGFLVTTGSISLLPYVASKWSWELALPILAAGPLVGLIAMAWLLRIEKQYQISPHAGQISPQLI
ncbi:MFS transporter [Citricoccus sp. NPDC055426]|uniref:MFS transporter n=1 Tax=Citricoccus sp. NPDC055426 TaxID=3155536 RepID=UPI00342B885F